MKFSQTLKSEEDEIHLESSLAHTWKFSVSILYFEELAMNIGDEIYSLCKLFYGPREGFPGIFYIRENSPLFPENFPPMKGKKLGKGSFYETANVEQHADSVLVELKVHVMPSSSSEQEGGDHCSEEFIILQKDIFTWDSDGTVNVFVDYPDPEGGASLAQSTGKLVKYSEDQWIFDFESAQIPCPPLTTQPWKNEVRSCKLRILHTDTLTHTDVTARNTVYSYDLMYIAFLNESEEILGTQKIDPAALFVPENPFLNATNNPIAWMEGA